MPCDKTCFEKHDNIKLSLNILKSFIELLSYSILDTDVILVLVANAIIAIFCIWPVITDLKIQILW